MKSLLICIFSLIVESTLCEKGYFYLTFMNGPERLLLKSDSPVDPNGGWIASGYYNNSANSTGWNVLEIITNHELDDEDQAYNAGWTEGYLTQNQIYNHWYNTQRTFCQNIPYTCDNIKNYIYENWKWIKSMLDSEDDDPFWHQVKLYYLQIDGLYDGYTNATKEHHIWEQNITREDIVLMNYVTDIITLTDSLGDETERRFISKTGRNSVLIKILPGYSDVFFAHNTWREYNYMNRVIKRYKFAYHWSANSTKRIPGQSQAFSSYAGVITSTDNFYIINSGLFVTETTNHVYDDTIYAYNKPNGQVLESVRSAVANRLSVDTKSWSYYFSMMNSGTHNSQWMIIDLKKFKPGFEPEKGFLEVLEQMPRMIVSKDQTQHIVAASYWASYNIPFYKDIFEYAGYKKMEKKYWPLYTYDWNARFEIFQREHTAVVDADSMIRVIRYNHFETDPYSVYDNCTLEKNACLSIASRCDLNPTNIFCPLKDIQFHLYGAIDAKIGSYSMFKKGEMIAVGGPSQSGGVLPPFNWTTAEDKTVPHLGQPDLWDFAPVLTSWIQPYAQASPTDNVVTIFRKSFTKN